MIICGYFGRSILRIENIICTVFYVADDNIVSGDEGTFIIGLA